MHIYTYIYKFKAKTIKATGITVIVEQIFSPNYIYNENEFQRKP